MFSMPDRRNPSVAGPLILAIGWCVCAGATEARAQQVIPLANAHAHNDYEHKRPLFDALDHGFGSVEADVFWVRGQMLVGHTAIDLRPERTLEKLYLEPLRRRIKTNGGRVYKNGPTIWLLVDVKTEAKATYKALHPIFTAYSDILSVVNDGRFEKKAVSVVISGNRARADIASPKVRYAGIDGRLADIDSTEPTHLIPWISDRWSAHFHWRGKGPMPDVERAKLKDIVRRAHQHGRLVRFWDTPDDATFWRELRADGVDLINTDELAKLQQFLTKG